MKSQKGFTSIEILIALTLLALTAGGIVALQQRKILPSKLSLSPTQSPTINPASRQEQSVNGHPGSWFTCVADADCALVPHPCCPGWTTIVANKSVVSRVSSDSLACKPIPHACKSARPPLPANAAIGCRSGRCVLLE